MDEADDRHGGKIWDITPDAVEDPSFAGWWQRSKGPVAAAPRAEHSVPPAAPVVLEHQEARPRRDVAPVLKVLALSTLGIFVFSRGADSGVGLMLVGIVLLAAATLMAAWTGMAYKERPEHPGLIRLAWLGGLVVAFCLFTSLLSALGSHSDPAREKWDQCVENVKNAIDQLSVITDSPKGDVAGAIITECGPRP